MSSTVLDIGRHLQVRLGFSSIVQASIEAVAPCLSMFSHEFFAVDVSSSSAAWPWSAAFCEKPLRIECFPEPGLVN